MKKSELNHEISFFSIDNLKSGVYAGKKRKKDLILAMWVPLLFFCLFQFIIFLSHSTTEKASAVLALRRVRKKRVSKETK